MATSSARASWLIACTACGPVLSVPSAGTSSGDTSSADATSLDAPTSATSVGETTGGVTSVDPVETGDIDPDDTGGESSEGGTTFGGGESTSESTGSVIPPPPDPTAHYEVTISNTWTEKTHPGALPSLAHFSWLGGATHNADITFWALGEFASPGIVYMAEIGNTDILSQEAAAAIEAGHADAVLQWQQWFCPPSTDVSVCGESTVAFDVALEFPRITLVTMLGPSPDLFVGVAGLPLVEDGVWVDEIVIDLVPYDGGTRSDIDFTMNGALQDPVQPITVVDSFDDHMIGPASLGTMTIVRVDGTR